MQAIDIVIFDIGNVLIRWDMRNLYRQMFATEAEIDTFLAETGLPEVNHRDLDGGAPFTSVIEALAARFPRHRESILAFDRRWTDCLDGAIDDNVGILADLKRAGTTTHAITNFSDAKFNVACGLFPFLTAFDETVVSGRVRLVKPDPAIFRVLFDKCRIDPARAVFIDDSAANIATAKSLGLNVVHFNEGQVDLRRALAVMGVAGL